MMDEEPDISWVVTISDLADADIEAAYQYQITFTEAATVEEWVRGFYFALLSLGDFPGPYANSIDEAATLRRGQEVRRLLYRGTKKRPRSFAYKAFYRAIAPLPGETDGTIVVDRIVHGASNYPNDAPDNDEE